MALAVVSAVGSDRIDDGEIVGESLVGAGDSVNGLVGDRFGPSSRSVAPGPGRRARSASRASSTPLQDPVPPGSAGAAWPRAPSRFRRSGSPAPGKRIVRRSYALHNLCCRLPMNTDGLRYFHGAVGFPAVLRCGLHRLIAAGHPCLNCADREAFVGVWPRSGASRDGSTRLSWFRSGLISLKKPGRRGLDHHGNDQVGLLPGGSGSEDNHEQLEMAALRGMGGGVTATTIGVAREATSADGDCSRVRG